MPDIIKIINKIRIPVHQLSIFNPVWEKEVLLEGVSPVKGNIDHFGDPTISDGLEALLSSIRNLKSIHLIGEITLYTLILRSLKNRLRFLQLKQNRDLEDLRLNPPVIITGLSRSGTTYLHRLISINKEFYAFPLWELFKPFVKPGFWDIRRLKTEYEIYIKNILLPELDKKHYTRANNTEECIMLLANSFNSQLFTDIAPLSGYLDWLLNSDRHKTYQEYRDQLKILQTFHPDKRFLLKAPNHLGNLEELLEYIPDATIIQMHRSPQECCNSLISLRKSLYKMVIHKIEPQEIRSQVIRLFDHEIRRNINFHNNDPCRIISVSYNSLVSEPLNVIRNIYKKASLLWSDEIERSSNDFITENPKDRRGVHVYENVQPDRAYPSSFENYRSFFKNYM